MPDRITKVTTKSGDGGTTRLATGEIHQKGDDQIELVGVLDEANCALGVLVQFIQPRYHDQLKQIQSRIFDIGAAVATGIPQPVWNAETETISIATKELNATVAPLKEFVIPGGGQASAHAHVARAKVRHAERVFWRVASDELRSSGQGAYLNRVSDYLFVLGRVVADQEETWQPLKPT
ncbi:MAG: cob(I)yrinic acid a,c-diamide adenosyltransferase [Gammaproteobacteria bacterium]|nr:cob(I)yrinic acid a,c-diamide adenosyltransferase [Gammaproteobacteria bacterium]MYF37200.1 cob(I)yrinic acid a,c-diamide adenosyltransferase [Gammaproteobacteria bacterium]